MRKLCVVFGLALLTANEAFAVGRVAVLDLQRSGDALAEVEAIIGAIAAEGLSVERKSAADIGRLTPGDAELLVVPACEALPGETARCILGFARAGGALLTTGGPFFSSPLCSVGGKWRTHAEMERAVSKLPSGHRTADEGLVWKRSCGPRTKGDAVFDSTNGCWRFDFAPLVDWDVFYAPDNMRIFGEGENVLTFDAKAEVSGMEVSLEMDESDGSRWVCVLRLGTEWKRYVLFPGDFAYWGDPKVPGRGGPTDLFRPSEQTKFGIGVSWSHNSGMYQRRVRVSLKDMASVRAPFSGAPTVKIAETMEGVWPEHKRMVVAGAACPVPRPMGEGIGGERWRFQPLRMVRDGVTGGEGAAEWLLLDRREKTPLRIVAGFGATNVAERLSPDGLSRLAKLARRMAGEPLITAAGTARFAYCPGEEVEIGVNGRATSEPVRVSCAVSDIHGKTVFSQIAQATNGIWRTKWSHATKMPSGVYRVEVRYGTDSLSHEFRIVSEAGDPPEAFIKVVGGGFRRYGKPWYANGINFWPLYVSGVDPEDFWQGFLRAPYYSPTLVERDLAIFEAMGGTFVSVQAPSNHEPWCLMDFLERCRQHGIFVNLYIDGTNPVAFDRGKVERFVREAHLCDHATVFAYDISWEPGNWLFSTKARERKTSDWRKWVREQYGSEARALKDWGGDVPRDADGVLPPKNEQLSTDGPHRVFVAAYRRFMDDWSSRRWGAVIREMRQFVPNQLISFRQGNTHPWDFALCGPMAHIDFVCPEGYVVPDTDAGENAIGWITRFAAASSGGKPIVWSEFGIDVWKHPDDCVAMQGTYDERFYRTGIFAGAVGTQPWWWLGGIRIDEHSDYGIMNPDGSKRPAAALVRKYAHSYRGVNGLPLSAPWPYDRDAHAGGYWRTAFNEGATAFGAARRQGKVLDVRLAGEGLSSATCPPIAIGNVPCDGTNPPKYLNAEFVRFDLNGEKLVVRFVNTGVASWLPGGVKGGVSLVVRDPGGREVARRPLSGEVVRHAFSEDMTIAVPSGMKGRVRLEAEGFAPFGECRSLHDGDGS